jgi:hypothetical protein
VLSFSAAAGGASARDERSTGIRVLKPEADTYVSAAEPNRNFGRSPVLRADGSPPATTYLRFRLKKAGRRAGSVTLLLHAHAGSRRAAFDVRRVPRNDWSEGEVTYATAPRPSLRYASSKRVRLGAWSAVDVTSFVVGHDDWITLAVTTRNQLGLAFRSRESNQGPILVVRTGREGPPD